MRLTNVVESTPWVSVPITRSYIENCVDNAMSSDKYCADTVWCNLFMNSCWYKHMDEL